ncbi:hypothetical protein [Streptomyces sp. NPDC058718]|uniref:hypothetical protein n=1 Tax=Streptomyces sp. NPDC058718 TaxID=3346610 RepID=UPI0036893CC2
MLFSHDFEDGVLHLSLIRDLDVTSRAAAAMRAEALLYAHRPRLVRLQLPTADPSPASLSVLARLRRLCEALGTPLSVFAPTATPQPPRTMAA